MFNGQPKGLWALALANTGERFGYYTMLAVFVLFLQANFKFSEQSAGDIYSGFLAFVYFLPFIGGILADRFGYMKMVTIGIFVMFLGYLLLAMPAGADTLGLVAMFAALALISIGTGLFKGNLQVLVGNLYDAPEYSSKRDAAFSIFYMAINIGAFFAPSVAVGIMKFGQMRFGVSAEDAYHFAFAVACVSLVFSIAIYYFFRSTFQHADGGKKKEQAVAAVEELSPQETKSRVVALSLVFAVVIFFWMAFHQNGLTLTFFARDYTVTSSAGLESMMFSVPNLLCVIVIVYALFSFFQGVTAKAKGISAALILASVVYLGYSYSTLSQSTEVSAPIFQQFNPLFVVMLTPVSMAIFGALANKGKEPKAPVKIGLGMLVAACGYLIMIIGAQGLACPAEQTAAIKAGAEVVRVSPNWLVSTYLVLTFAELLLSPMGISFVSKVAPPKLKGMMMGGWFVATAIGNYGTKLGSELWGNMPLWVVWAAFSVLCLLSALFIFSVIKKLNKVA